MKKVFAIAVAAALLVGITALTYGKSPAKKATGGVETDAPNAWRASFSAHEGPNADGTDGKGQIQRSSAAAGRSFHLIVKYVKVEGNKAWFAARCTRDSGTPNQVNNWFFMKVLDGGSPGAGNDFIWWQWFTDETDARDAVIAMDPPTQSYSVTNGNLVVH